MTIVQIIAWRRHAAAVLASLFATPAIGCDAADPSSDEERAIHCNLSDPECAALPELAEAIEVVKSMGIDPDRESVDLWVGEAGDIEAVGPAAAEHAPESRGEVSTEEAAAQTSPDASLSAPVDAQELPRMACSAGDGACYCCCWAGYRGEWGCDCFSCW